MALILRLLCVVMSFAFIAGTTVHGFTAAKMEFDMQANDIIVDSSGEECGNCVLGENTAGTCELVCNGPVSFLISENTSGDTRSVKRSLREISARLEVGIAPDPDPFPPRTFILI